MTEGTNELLGSSPERLESALSEVVEGRAKRGRIPELWDGRAAERILDVLQEHRPVPAGLAD